MLGQDANGAPSSAPSRTDVLVVGGGPAGLCLAAHIAARGLSTTLLALGLGEQWDRSYGTFAKDVPASELEEAVKRRFSRPVVRVGGREPITLSEEYLRFDTGALQSLLFERAARAGVRFVSGRLIDVQFDRSERRTICNSVVAPQPGDVHWADRAARFSALLVVNAAGGAFHATDAVRRAPSGYQTAYGEWIEVEEHHFGEGEMSLMDYRTIASSGPPSFLYAMPESGGAHGPGVLFVQETVLVGSTPLTMALLQERLSRRLESLGLRRTRTLGTERCVIPMGGALPERDGLLLPFGAAAGLIHPATGYQLATALALAPGVAKIVAEGLCRGSGETVAEAMDFMWPDSKRRAYRFYELGAATLTTLSPALMEEFIANFFSLSGGRWQRFMAGSMAASEIAETMWTLFADAPNSLRANLFRGGSKVTSRLLAQMFN